MQFAVAYAAHAYAARVCAAHVCALEGRAAWSSALDGRAARASAVDGRAAHASAAHSRAAPKSGSDPNFAHDHAAPKLGSDPNFADRDFRWYRAPIFWVALALFVASVAGCIVTIMLALGAPDGALPDVGERLLSVPTEHAEDTR